MPRGIYPRPSMANKFWAKVKKQEGCWEWCGSRNQQGYGNFRAQKAHRVAYELLVGPIPQGMILDHLCRNHGCVNPMHLEPVSNRENVLRGVGPTALSARKTHCVNGHEFTDENTYRRKDAPGRKCRICMKAQMEDYRATCREERPAGNNSQMLPRSA